ncbi:acyl dehydratase [Haloactinopolyspora alba]|uniref:Acyl dehydratase n=1 Tax=Haloactinopolyspora alba TaxID=648780 RepID=A0A2P8E9K0_9ACTN|nr:MaoC family dehydratase [Haloactinopolyspora alba]PSL06125.1 acyl dehydratase [Haloactinopolyspora alba]
MITTGDRTSVSKTVGESDVYLFAGITGDLSPNHVDETFMARTTYGRRVAHGVLLLGYASAASTTLLSRTATEAVSYGYDRLRFTAPVFIGDTVTVDYVVTSVDDTTGRVEADVTVRNQDGDVCLVAAHTMKLL